MESNVVFLQTVTVGKFKAEQHAESLEIKSANDGKYFFTCGGAQGPVATKNHTLNEVLAKPMMSFCQGTPTEKCPDGKFWMLHLAGEGLAPVAVL